MSDLVLMVRLFIGIFYPKAVEPLQQSPSGLNGKGGEERGTENRRP